MCEYCGTSTLYQIDNAEDFSIEGWHRRDAEILRLAIQDLRSDVSGNFIVAYGDSMCLGVSQIE